MLEHSLCDPFIFATVFVISNVNGHYRILMAVNICISEEMWMKTER